ncbi:hypothetical protein ACHAWF_017399 [Thalassiosira exigua]
MFAMLRSSEAPCAIATSSYDMPYPQHVLHRLRTTVGRSSRAYSFPTGRHSRSPWCACSTVSAFVPGGHSVLGDDVGREVRGAVGDEVESDDGALVPFDDPLAKMAGGETKAFPDNDQQEEEEQQEVQAVALLPPLPVAVDDHQRHAARAVDRGRGVLPVVKEEGSPLSGFHEVVVAEDVVAKAIAVPVDARGNVPHEGILAPRGTASANRALVPLVPSAPPGGSICPPTGGPFAPPPIGRLAVAFATSSAPPIKTSRPTSSSPFANLRTRGTTYSDFHPSPLRRRDRAILREASSFEEESEEGGATYGAPSSSDRHRGGSGADLAAARAARGPPEGGWEASADGALASPAAALAPSAVTSVDVVGGGGASTVGPPPSPPSRSVEPLMTKRLVLLRRPGPARGDRRCPLSVLPADCRHPEWPRIAAISPIPIVANSRACPRKARPGPSVVRVPLARCIYNIYYSHVTFGKSALHHTIRVPSRLFGRDSSRTGDQYWYIFRKIYANIRQISLAKRCTSHRGYPRDTRRETTAREGQRMSPARRSRRRRREKSVERRRAKVGSSVGGAAAAGTAHQMRFVGGNGEQSFRVETSRDRRWRIPPARPSHDCRPIVAAASLTNSQLARHARKKTKGRLDDDRDQMDAPPSPDATATARAGGDNVAAALAAPPPSTSIPSPPPRGPPSSPTSPGAGAPYEASPRFPSSPPSPAPPASPVSPSSFASPSSPTSPAELTAPEAPRWRFVESAKKSSGYSSAHAGAYVKGKSSEELGAKYAAPDVSLYQPARERADVRKVSFSLPRENEFEKDDVEVGKLRLGDGGPEEGGDAAGEVGKFRLEEVELDEADRPEGSFPGLPRRRTEGEGGREPFKKWLVRLGLTPKTDRGGEWYDGQATDDYNPPGGETSSKNRGGVGRLGFRGDGTFASDFGGDVPKAQSRGAERGGEVAYQDLDEHGDPREGALFGHNDEYISKGVAVDDGTAVTEPNEDEEEKRKLKLLYLLLIPCILLIVILGVLLGRQNKEGDVAEAKAVGAAVIPPPILVVNETSAPSSSLAPTASPTKPLSNATAPLLAPTPPPTPAPTPSPTCSRERSFNLCLAVDMSGSVCNGDTGTNCLDCRASFLPMFFESACRDRAYDEDTCCENFAKVKAFAGRLVNALGDFPAEKSFSVVQFATDARLASGLNDADWTNLEIGRLDYAGGLTNHMDAIRTCQRTFESSADGGRRNFVVLVTDGTPTEPAYGPEAYANAAAAEAKADGTHIIPVFISPNGNDPTALAFMNGLSSDGKAFDVTNFDSLNSLQDQLVDQVSCS